MLQIVRNTTNIKELQGEKYVLRACPKGVGPMYAKVSLRRLLSYFAAVKDFRQLKRGKSK